MTSSTHLHESPFSKAPYSRPYDGSPKPGDQAAMAALHVMQPEDTTKATNEAPLSDTGLRLSTAGCTWNLQSLSEGDLPSSLGSPSGPSSACAAASLASSPHKLTSRLKSDPSASAFSAAVLAKDLKPAEQWQPEPSAHGAKAALLAHSRSSMEISSPHNSTSSQSLLPKLGPKPQPDPDYTTLGKIGSLKAVTGAMAAKRQRSGSAPTITGTWLNPECSAADALNAATVAHSPSMKSATFSVHGLPSTSKTDPMPLDFSRIHSIARDNVTRALTSTHAIPSQESSDGNRVDVQAATLSIARQFFTVQQSPTSAHLSTLEEEASKIAIERLARLHIEHESYRNCRRMDQARAMPLIQGRARRRAASEGQCKIQDEEQSGKIRYEMSQLTAKVAQVEAKKRERDCASLVAVAHKNVQASMHKMDEEILSYTGRLAPSMQREWEAKAIAAAEAESKIRMSSYGKIDIGGGKFMDQEEVNAVAAKKVRPLLDELNEKAEKERAKQEQIKREEQERKRVAKEDLLRERDLKDERKKTKGEHFASHMSPLETLEHKSKKAEQKRICREERQPKRAPEKLARSEQPAATSREIETKEPHTANPLVTDYIVPHRQDEGPVLNPLTEDDPVSPHVLVEGPALGVSPITPTSNYKDGVKKWLKEFSKRTNKSHGPDTDHVGNGKPPLEGMSPGEHDLTRSLELSSPSVGEATITGGGDPPSLRDRDNRDYLPNEGGARDNRKRGSVSTGTALASENMGLSYAFGHASSDDNGHENASHIFDEGSAPEIATGTTDHVCRRSVYESKFIEDL
ncbi:hypothetical protein GP486_000485 [Trichoglossum hirsutum]|uniref:Eisosome protein 1 n=1 Tax=Trichoglossum hirsutum TaxID=265104 RepID=A0A9P8LIY5_9PEZI|nr:hypothetical protein GP486_000485 [Trichoglossum hirsutum]